MIRTIEIMVATKGHCDVHDLTDSVHDAIRKSGLREGQVLVFIPGSTAGVTTVEFEPGVVRDLREFFDAIIPEGRDYHHHATWGDDNGASHLRAALLKPAARGDNVRVNSDKRRSGGTREELSPPAWT